jgi:hypothetical protein
MDDLLFCDDCGSVTHEWRDCPLTRDNPHLLNDPEEYDEPADIDDDHGMNPYDGTYDWMEGGDDISDDWQSEADW